jgi:TRAP transporter T-component
MMFRRAAVLAAALSLFGCASIVQGITSDLTRAVLDQPDPEIVRDGAPAYLIMADTLIQRSPDSVGSLAAGAKLYTAYASIFVDDRERRQTIADRAWDYGRRAMCAEESDFCGAHDRPYAEFQALVEELDHRQVEVATAYAMSWLAWIEAHSDDWVAVADLPRPELVIERLLKVEETYDAGTLHLLMGRIKTLRPAALGGDPTAGLQHFERAIELSEGRNLMAIVQCATSYARLVYDREMHDRLLEQVLATDPVAPGYTLTNVMAQRQARELLESADDYF